MKIRKHQQRAKLHCSQRAKRIACSLVDWGESEQNQWRQNRPALMKQISIACLISRQTNGLPATTYCLYYKLYDTSARRRPSNVPCWWQLKHCERVRKAGRSFAHVFEQLESDRITRIRLRVCILRWWGKSQLPIFSIETSSMYFFLFPFLFLQTLGKLSNSRYYYVRGCPSIYTSSLAARTYIPTFFRIPDWR